MTADSVAIAAAPVRRESGFARSSSMYCSYHYDMNSHVFITDAEKKIEFGSQTFD